MSLIYPIIVIGGPTAVGKTAISLELAKNIDAEIISADSRQVYRELIIGVARPSDEELRRIKHHFIAEKSIQENFTTADFATEAKNRISEIRSRGKNVLVTGGTGFYIKALTEGLDDIPSIDPSIRKKLTGELNSKGLEFLLDELKEKDPSYHSIIEKENPRRVIRALEVIRQTKSTFSGFLGKKDNDELDSVMIALDRDREELYERINWRVEKMMDEGLLEEVKSLAKSKSLPALNTVGYNECFDFIEGKIGREQAIELIKRNTRRYAKRQLTWFRNKGNYSFINISGYSTEKVIEKIQSHLV